MERFPVELLYLLAFVGFVIYNFVVQLAARRRQQEEAARAPAAPEPEAEEIPEDVWGPAPVQALRAVPVPMPALAPRATPLPMAPPAPRRRHPARALLDDPRSLRRAVVLMMVLGPCRAQEEPPER